MLKDNNKKQSQTKTNQSFDYTVRLIGCDSIQTCSFVSKRFTGQLQRFHKFISNDRIWPSEHGFEVIFEKSLFVFEMSTSKVRNKRGIHSRFHSFSENKLRETFVCDVTSDQSSMISTERSDLGDCKVSGNC